MYYQMSAVILYLHVIFVTTKWRLSMHRLVISSGKQCRDPPPPPPLALTSFFLFFQITIIFIFCIRVSGWSKTEMGSCSQKTVTPCWENISCIAGLQRKWAAWLRRAGLMVAGNSDQCECKQSNESIMKCEVRTCLLTQILNTIFSNTLLNMQDVFKADQCNSTLL